MRQRRKSVYYAHAMCIYGRDAEREELSTIRRYLPKSRIVNPADYSRDPEKVADTMGFCLGLVAGADSLVFSRLLGKVTAGVGKEVNHAIRLGKPVFELRAQKLVKRMRPLAYLTRRATLKLYERWRYLNGWGR